MNDILIKILFGLLIILILYLISLKQDLIDKEKIIQNQKILHKEQNIINKNFTEKWKVKKEEYSNSIRKQYEKNDTINTSIGYHSINF